MASALLCNVSTYYAATGWLPLSGSALLAALHTHVSGDVVLALPYTSSSSTDVWDALYVLDADEENPSHVVELYSQRSVPANESGLSTGWNREHLWPKSYGVGYSGADYTDLHHLRAADWNVNSARGNKPFGECSNERDSTCYSPAHADAASDTAANPSLFMPPAAVRGDIARALFFMAARYDGTAANTEALVLSKCPTALGYAMGNLTVLLKWHADDPADAREVWRTSQVCARFQGNRNPFVDNSSLAERIWGDGSDFDDVVCRTGYSDVVPSPLPVPTQTEPPTSTNEAQDAETCLHLTSVVDGDRSGGLPKAVELFVLCDISDLSEYGLGSANNGGGSDGKEYSFPSSSAWARGDFMYVSYESSAYPGSFQFFFGFAPNYTATALNTNGDDAMELFYRSEVVDQFGNASYQRTPSWGYADGWAYRAQGTRAAGAWRPLAWTIREGALKGYDTNSAAGESKVPIQTYRLTPSPCPTLTKSTSQPTLLPSWADTITVAVRFSLVASAALTMADESTLKTTLASSLGLASDSSIKRFAVISNLASTRRRILSSYSWDISFEALLSLGASSYNSASSAATGLASILSGAEFQSALESSLGASVLSIDLASVSTEALRVTSAHPTAVPTGPVVISESSNPSNSRIDTAAALGFAAAAVIVILIISAACNRSGGASSSSLGAQVDSSKVESDDTKKAESSGSGFELSYLNKAVSHDGTGSFHQEHSRLI
jgi:endonuclease I